MTNTQLVFGTDRFFDLASLRFYALSWTSPTALVKLTPLVME
jgi:hypothetical protein